jgi:hypothetical protein
MEKGLQVSDEEPEDINDVVDELFDRRQAILDHVKYRERWRDFPFDDGREYYWAVIGGSIKFSPDRAVVERQLADEETADDDEKNLYESEISDHDGESGIYRGDVLTLVVADTNTDGNVFLQIFCNDREVAEPVEPMASAPLNATVGAPEGVITITAHSLPPDGPVNRQMTYEEIQMWLRNEEGRCAALSPDRDRICVADVGHEGWHDTSALDFAACCWGVRAS